MRAIALFVGFGLATTPAAVEAHHSISAQYFTDRTEVIEGVLTKVDWQNPHAWFHFKVTMPDGTVQTWATELMGPAGLRRIGVTEERVPLGAVYKVEFSPDRSGQRFGFTRSLVLPDGDTIEFRRPR